jgi:hypothetical protein
MTEGEHSLKRCLVLQPRHLDADEDGIELSSADVPDASGGSESKKKKKKGGVLRRVRAPHVSISVLMN